MCFAFHRSGLHLKTVERFETSEPYNNKGAIIVLHFLEYTLAMASLMPTSNKSPTVCYNTPIYNLSSYYKIKQRPRTSSHTHTHTNTHTHTHTRTHTNTHTYTHAHTYTCTHIYIHTHKRTRYRNTRMHTHTHALASVPACSLAHTHARAHARPHTNKKTQTRKHAKINIVAHRSLFLPINTVINSFMDVEKHRLDLRASADSK